jgi:hypothetical protein
VDTIGVAQQALPLGQKMTPEDDEEPKITSESVNSESFIVAAIIRLAVIFGLLELAAWLRSVVG